MAQNDLNELELRFIYSSTLVTILLGLFVLLSSSFVIGLIYISPAVTTLIVNIWAGDVANRITDDLRSSTSSSDIERDIKWLASRRVQIVIPGATLSDMNLSDIVANFTNLTNSKIRSVSFFGADLRGSTFIKSTISDVDFTTANLQQTGFDNSKITSAKSGTSFKGANLSRVKFDGSILCGVVDFSDAIVRFSSFQDVGFSEVDFPNFEGTAWWLMQGLSADLRQKFLVGFPAKHKILPGLVDELDVARGKLERAEPHSYHQALWLNDVAWTLALYGVYYPSDSYALSSDTAIKSDNREFLETYTNAEEFVRKSIDSYRYLINHAATDPDREGLASGDVTILRRNLADANDTLAYILFQRANSLARETNVASKNDTNYIKHILEFHYIREALALWQSANNMKNDREIMYRYAVALNAVNKKTEATKYYTESLQERGYIPTHELYLLANFKPKQPMEPKSSNLTGEATERCDPDVATKR